MNGTLEYATDFRPIDREDKAKYVWLKYHPILEGKILDVGADQCYLKDHLDSSKSDYLGIGVGEGPDMQVDLEKNKLPFTDGSFDCVLCLDVLEHLDNLHEIFDDVCRVSRRYALISLPNPWGSFFRLLRGKDHTEMTPFLHYGLPVEPLEDRHKWFFSIEEAERFVHYRAGNNQMKIIQMDTDCPTPRPLNLKRLLRLAARNLLIRRDLNDRVLQPQTLWTLLERAQP